MDRNEKPLGARLGEAGFCIVYLVFMVCISAILKGRFSAESAVTGIYPPQYYKYGFGFMMAVLLVSGDAFHLIPRIVVNLSGSMPRKEFFLGLGNLISSMTMTIFYNVLIAMGDSMEYDPSEYNYWIEKAILILTLVRLVLLVFPQNKWFTSEPAGKWAVIRNVPFIFIGILTVVGFINVIQHANNYPVSFYILLIICVIFSFVFYIPVAIWGKEKPKLGMLMIPKTLAYMVMMSVICFM